MFMSITNTISYSFILSIKKGEITIRRLPISCSEFKINII